MAVHYINPIEAINTYKRVNNTSKADTEPLKLLKMFGVGNGKNYGYGEGNKKFSPNNGKWFVDNGGYCMYDGEHKMREYYC